MVTYNEFFRDCQNFLQHLKERSFWELPMEVRESQFENLGTSFSQLSSMEENTKAIRLFEALSSEYSRRTAAALLHGPIQVGIMIDEYIKL